MMELRHVHYFLAIADAGSVTAAARRVHVAQPSISRQIRQLETDLGVALFERDHNRLTLTPTGRSLLPTARALARQAEELVAAAEFHASGGLRRMTIVAPAVTLTDVVAPYVATLSGVDDHPTVDVLASDRMTAHEMATRGDLVITTEGPGREFASVQFTPLPVWAYVAPTHRWSELAGIAFGELLTERLILLPPGYSSRQVFDAALRGAGRHLGESTEAANGTIAQALAAAGRGIAVVSDDRRFDLRPVAIDLDSTRLAISLSAFWDMHHLGERTLAEVARRLASFVRDRFGTGSDGAATSGRAARL
ncbi:LysR family transcriptional regulator [Gordonia terrae]|uniref:LysR family transcriptional regulator n=1 Tax=Gordonia hongkongensis TaxID=1701090 RepID=UPI0022B493B7|nr:LysR family transcriptional regulator [Gordonia terrae]